MHGADALYGMDVDASYLTKIDVAGRRATDQFPIPADPYWLLPRTAFGSIWVTDSHAPTVERIDPRYRQVVARIRLPDATNDGSLQRAEGIAATPNAIWVAFGYPIRIARIDPATNRVTLVRGLPDGAAWGFDVLLAASGQNLWAIARDGSRFVRLDERTGEVVARGKLHDGWVEDAAVAGGYLWVPMQSDSGVWQVDPTGVGRRQGGDRRPADRCRRGRRGALGAERERRDGDADRPGQRGDANVHDGSQPRRARRHSRARLGLAATERIGAARAHPWDARPHPGCDR